MVSLPHGLRIVGLGQKAYGIERLLGLTKPRERVTIEIVDMWGASGVIDRKKSLQTTSSVSSCLT